MIPRNCPECGVELPPHTGRGKRRVFCCDEHKQAHANRRTVRGKALAAVAMGWRKTRGSGELGKYLFSEMTLMLDQWNAEDREAGRMAADDYARTLGDAGLGGAGRYIDRQVSKVRCVEKHQGCHGTLGFTGASPEIARRGARGAGWLVDGENVVCPNCRDDNVIEKVN